MSRPFSCGLAAALDLVGGKWKLLILFHLAKGPRRFGQLRRDIGGVTEKVLSQQLRALTTDGVVRRMDFATVPPHVEYELTAFGEDLCLALRPLCEWGDRNMAAIGAIAAARG